MRNVDQLCRLVGTPTGIVAGDDDLSLDGPWGGIDLRFEWAW